MADIFDLVAKLTLNTKEYENGLTEAQNKGSSFGSKIATAGKVAAAGVAAVGTAVVGIASGFANATSELAQYGDQIDKNSQKLGVSAGFYQEWDAVLKHSGTSMEGMSATFKTLAKASQSATDDQQAAFEKLGLSIEQVSSMSTEDLFSNVITQLQGMEESTERTALASTLLGRGAMEMGALLNTSAEDTQGMIDTARELGGVMSDEAVKSSAAFKDNLQDLQTALTGTKNNMLAEFLPSVNEVLSGLTAVFSGDDSGLGQVNEGIDQFLTQLTDSLPKILEVGGSIVEGLASGIVDNLPKIFSTVSDLVLTLSQKIIEGLPQLVQTGLQIIVTLAESIGQSLPTLIPTIVDVVLQIVDTLTENVDLLIDGAIALIIGLAEGLISSLPKLIERIPEIVVKVVEALIRNAPKLLDAALELILTLAKGLTNYLPKLITEIPKMVLKIYNAFISQKEKLKEAGRNFVTGLWEGFKENWSNFINNVLGQAKELISKVKGVFGIASPSKVFKQIGEYCVQGLNDGGEGLFSSEGLSAKVSADVTGRNSTTDAVIDLLSQYLPTIASGNQIVLDTGALVGSTASLYNAELGRIAARGAYV